MINYQLIDWECFYSVILGTGSPKSGGCIVEEGTDYGGHDLPKKNKKTGSQQECARFSALTPGGLFWTWNKVNKICYVKSSNAGKRKVGHAVSGNKCGPDKGKFQAPVFIVVF